MKKNKITLISGLSIFITCILVLTIYYSVFANSSQTRTFDEPTNFYKKNLSPQKPKEISEEFKTPAVRLNASILNETPKSLKTTTLDFYLRQSTNGYGSEVDNYVKIEIQNLSNFKNDENNSTLYCNIYTNSYNYELDEEKNIYFDTIEIPKNENITYIFKSPKPFYHYYLDFYHKSNLAPSFNVKTTVANSLEDLGVNNITNLYKEKTLPISTIDKEHMQMPGRRTFILDVGNYENLDLKFNNTSNNEYSLFLYDISDDIFSFKTMTANESLYKEYTIPANSNFSETFNNSKFKRYELNLVPTILKDDYLKIKKLESEIKKENMSTFSDIKINNKKQLELDKLNKSYNEKFNEIIKNQKGNLYYKYYN